MLLFLVTFVFYVKSFVRLHGYTSQVQAQQPNPSHGKFDVVKYRKTMATIASCYFTYCLPGVHVIAIFVVGLPKSEPISNLFELISNMTLVIFSANSSINTVIYLTRFTDNRHEFSKSLKEMFLF